MVQVKLERWDVISGCVPAEGFSLSFVEAFVTPMVFYAIWQVFYLYIQYTVIDHDPELVTSLRYLTQVINTLGSNIVLIKP